MLWDLQQLGLQPRKLCFPLRKPILAFPALKEPQGHAPMESVQEGHQDIISWLRCNLDSPFLHCFILKSWNNTYISTGTWKLRVYVWRC